MARPSNDQPSSRPRTSSLQSAFRPLPFKHQHPFRVNPQEPTGTYPPSPTSLRSLGVFPLTTHQEQAHEGQRQLSTLPELDETAETAKDSAAFYRERILSEISKQPVAEQPKHLLKKLQENLREHNKAVVTTLVLWHILKEECGDGILKQVTTEFGPDVINNVLSEARILLEQEKAPSRQVYYHFRVWPCDIGGKYKCPLHRAKELLRKALQDRIHHPGPSRGVPRDPWLISRDIDSARKAFKELTKQQETPSIVRLRELATTQSRGVPTCPDTNQQPPPSPSSVRSFTQSPVSVEAPRGEPQPLGIYEDEFDSDTSDEFDGLDFVQSADDSSYPQSQTSCLGRRKMETAALGSAPCSPKRSQFGVRTSVLVLDDEDAIDRTS